MCVHRRTGRRFAHARQVATCQVGHSLILVCTHACSCVRTHVKHLRPGAATALQRAQHQQHTSCSSCRSTHTQQPPFSARAATQATAAAATTTGNKIATHASSATPVRAPSSAAASARLCTAPRRSSRLWPCSSLMRRSTRSSACHGAHVCDVRGRCVSVSSSLYECMPIVPQGPAGVEG